VIAYKFLDGGRVGPFTGFRWPVGEWVDAGGVDPCLEGIHHRLDLHEVRSRPGYAGGPHERDPNRGVAV